ncbi:hypothetical protein ANA_C13030 [Anabaena sp. 90]|nr:hypothetical protein ANA_C13030 [Anabaena sp. 90]
MGLIATKTIQKKMMTVMNDGRWEGWRNYETYVISMWITNNGLPCESSASELEKYFESLKNHFLENKDSILFQPLTYLLTASFEEIDWQEIADEFNIKEDE